MYFNFRLFALTRGLRLKIMASTIAGLVALSAGIGRLALIGWIIAEVFLGTSFSDLWLFITGLGVLIIARSLGQYTRDRISYSIATKTKIHIREKLHQHIISLGPEYVERRRSGDILVSMVDSVESLEIFFGQYVSQFLVALVAPFIIFTFISILNIQISLIFLFFALLTLFIPTLMRSWTDPKGRNRRQAFGTVSAEFLDSIHGLATLKALGQSKAQLDILSHRARQLYKSAMGVVALEGVSSATTLLGISVGTSAALIWGSILVKNDRLELSILIVVLMLGGEIFRPIRELAMLYHQGMVAMASAEGIFALLDTPPSINSPANTQTDRFNGSPTSSTSPDIRFESVTFGYDNGQRPALKNLSFNVSRNDTLGIVGHTGAGKSTILWLLLRFYDPQKGRVLIGGRDIKDIPLETLRNQISIVTQETFLFDGTVAENLRIGKPDADLEEIEEAARTANAHEFISELPKAYDTYVGERGIALSGGERQRIAIARALLKNSPILVFDEAVSNIDSENEAEIQKALDVLMKDKTSIVIAHRLSSVIGTDRILVLDDGHQIETGTHEELSNTGSIYNSLMKNQQVAVSSNIIASNRVNRPKEAINNAQTDTPKVTNPPEFVFGPIQPWTRLLKAAMRWKISLTLTLVLGIAHHASVIGLGAASAMLVAAVYGGGNFTFQLILLATIAPATAAFRWGENWFAHNFAYKILSEMRIDLYNKLEPLAPGYLLNRKSGDLTAIVGGDIEIVENFFAHVITPALIAVLIPILVVTVLAMISWPIALILIPFIFISAVSPLISQSLAKPLGKQMRETLGELNAYLLDSIQGIREIVAFGNILFRNSILSRIGLKYSDYRIRFLKTQSANSAFIDCVTATGSLAVLTFSVWLTLNGELESRHLPLVTLLSLYAFGPISELAATLQQLVDTRAATHRIFEIHDEPVLVRDGPGFKRSVTGRFNRDIHAASFDDVSFSYSSSGQNAIRNVSFAIRPSQTVALVGQSGAGKSTIVNMLLRYWDPGQGTVVIDGTDIRQFNLEDLRSRIALVSQDTYLFNTSILENLRMARRSATYTEIEKAAKAANIHDFITSLSESYATTVGERGAQLSGGERQRISIARALLKDAPILILDEATSHLDSLTEQRIRTASSILMKNRTTLVIAHRLSTVQDADHIVVLKSGQIAEQGTHEHLLEKGTYYVQLIKNQLVTANSQSDLTT